MFQLDNPYGISFSTFSLPEYITLRNPGIYLLVILIMSNYWAPQKDLNVNFPAEVFLDERLNEKELNECNMFSE